MNDPWSADADEWEGFVERIDGMIADGGYERDENFLENVAVTVRHSHRVSDRQRKAIDDIEERVRGRG